MKPPALPPELAEAIPVTAQGKIDWWQVTENWVAALAILLIGLWLAKWISRIIGRLNARTHMDATLNGFLSNLAYVFLLVVVIIASMDKLGVPINSALAILATAGLAIGLAIKDSLANIAAGVMLIALRPFRVGDTVQAATQEGTVEEVRLFQTRLRTGDGRLLILPNSSITNAPIINFTAKPRRRIDLTVSVGYGDDLKQARQVLLAIAEGDGRVLKEPAPAVLVNALAESSVDMVLQVWVKTYQFGEVRSDLIEAVRDQILGNGMSIPYPQRDLHVYHHDADGRPMSEVLARAVTDDGDKVAHKPVVSGNS